MLISFLILFLSQWSLVSSQIFLYDTRPASMRLSQSRFNCLQYSNLQDWRFVITLEYCLRPSDTDEYEFFDDSLPTDGHQRFTFQQLSNLNITAEDLLQWSTSADLAEDYQYYLNHNDTRLTSQEVFHCTPPWFGPRCQYSFVLKNRRNSFDLIERLIQMKMKTKLSYNDSYVTCYIPLNCTYDGQPICLQWNQICDGRVDCIDGGEDELSCFALEMNECENDEYRCHNGLCIPQKFVGDGTAECLDRSDILTHTDREDNSIDVNVREFIWKEQGCRPGQRSFTCGDGRCVRDFETCRNGRDHIINTWISSGASLTKQCRIIMICLTKIMDQVDGISCQSFFQSTPINESIMHCDSIIRFPIKPVLLHHIYFLYQRQHLLTNSTGGAFIPAYICYDARLCEHLQPSFQHHHLSCRTADQMGLNSSITYPTWLSIINTIRPHFDGCMLFKRNASSSLYCCRNSSKCISRHRIVDGIVDCPYRDDEQAFELSCSIHNQHRFRCENEQQCRSLLYPADVCPPRRFLDLKDILFQEICNRIPQTKPQLIDGSIHTDETECHEWACSNVYTRCDHYWNCPNGEDERNCPSSLQKACPIGRLACLSVLNYTMICLAGEKVSDGVMDCLGGADEESVCRQHIETYSYPGFLCKNQTKCIVLGDLCDEVQDCLFGEDEALCDGRLHICEDMMHSSLAPRDQHLCSLARGERVFFSFENLPIHPPIQVKTYLTSNIRPRSLSSQDTPIPGEPIPPIAPHPWYCHEGLAAVVRLGSDRFMTRCFCPPNFYGDRCQYQNQRVAITLKLHPVNKQGVRSFFVTLISDDSHEQDNIHSHHQFSLVVENTCGKTFKFFLLYSTRPKNSSKKYFIKIDVFDQSTLIHLASWRYPILFVFLPVNPMVIVLQVPAKPISSSSNRCSLKCDHGRCMQYLNNDEFYCHCDQGWTGKRCHQPVKCDDCAADSICVGSFENRSICMCPINRFGRRCLLQYSCGEDFECQNGGRCVIVDPSRSGEGYGCLCPKEYHGIFCHVKKSVLQLVFKNIDVTSNLLVHRFEPSNDQSLQTGKASLLVFGQKLRMFEKSATLYVGGFLQIVFVQFELKYYLAVLARTQEIINISTTITPKQECPHFNELAVTTLRSAPEIRRVKYYHQICRLHAHLMCFVDDNYFCLCTNERHANCLPMQRDFRCPQDVHCQNGAQCLQEHPECPSMTFCICSNCFFGDRCQFYVKGIGLTLDDFLRYEIQPRTSLTDQNLSIKMTAALSVIIFVVGLANSILALVTFRRKRPRQVGTGIYLYASSITSLLTVTMFNIKVWFLVATHSKEFMSQSVLHAGCVGIEPMLKVCLYTDSWLNGCVAIERAITICKGVTFNQGKSKRVAKWMVAIAPLLVFMSLIHEFIHRELYDDEEEQRIWCIMRYSSSINAYSTFILSFHTITPFLANFFSAILIIVQSARRKAHVQRSRGFWKHMQEQLKEHRHLIISPIILTILSLPRVIISSISDCVKANRSPWLYLVGYFVSLIPSVVMSIVFILPSPLYREELHQGSKVYIDILQSVRRRFQSRS